MKTLTWTILIAFLLGLPSYIALKDDPQPPSDTDITTDGGIDDPAGPWA